MELGKRIKQARENAKLTQKELAERVEKGSSTIQKYELDLVSPPLVTLDKISKILNVPLADLLEVDPSDPVIKWTQNLPQPRKLPDDMQILQKLLWEIGFDLDKYKGKYYLTLDNDAFEVTEKEIRQLEKQTADFLKFLCKQLEEAHAPEPLPKNHSSENFEENPISDK